MTARVSGPVYTTSPTAEPAARTVFDQRTFSAVSGATDGMWFRGTDSMLCIACAGAGVLSVNVPTKVWMSLIGVSA